MRVSSTDQNMARQHMELVRWGIEEKGCMRIRCREKTLTVPLIRNCGSY